MPLKRADVIFGTNISVALETADIVVGTVDETGLSVTTLLDDDGTPLVDDDGASLLDG